MAIACLRDHGLPLGLSHREVNFRWTPFITNKRMQEQGADAVLITRLVKKYGVNCRGSTRSQIEILKEEYHEIRCEGPGGRHVSRTEG